MKITVLLSLTPLLVSASPFWPGASNDDVAPLVTATNAESVPDSYMVVFKKDVSHDEALLHHTWVQDLHLQTETAKAKKRDLSQLALSAFQGLKHTYHIPGSLLGYSGHFDEDVIDRVRKHPQVAYVEQDSVVHTMEQPEIMDEPELEKNSPWGLSRISHREGLTISTVGKYLYSEHGGEGVDVYVIDTGTNVEHVDFEGRAHWGKTIPAGDEDLDGNGHGTHCSGTIAGKKFGVAKKANVYAVKVLTSNGSGTMSDVVKGVEWAAVKHSDNVEATKKGKGKKGFKGSAANMSLGGGKSTTLDLAVNAAVEAGIHFAVAAGNDNADSCSYSPARAENAVTVGASDILDQRAYFSNYGPCNDIFAPGLDIRSAWIGSKYATKTISGTSMASPHIAGLLAYFLSLQPPTDSAFAVEELTPERLKKNLIAIGTVDKLTEVPDDTENVLAWNGGGSSNMSEVFDQRYRGASFAHKSTQQAQQQVFVEL